ncbi:MAG TPA: hypothetical protein PLR96_02985 [Flavobacteriales bacterium]|mgnify:CR=1 FL=1|nr:hypothetical protein [Flavobacteriales bacterium]
MSTPTAERISRWAFALIVLVVLVDRAWLLRTTIGYASDDLAVVWLATTDYAQGILHEPFFYGQDYGVMLEALLAAPFVRLGADPISTVAILFALFGIAPYLAFAFHHRSRKEYGAALLFAAMPLLLPVEHGLQITALNGIAVLAFVPLAWRCTPSFARGFWLMLVLGVAVFVNPNAALVAVPIGVHHILSERRDLKVWSAMALGMLPALLLWVGARWFFQAQEAQVVNTIFDWRLHFKPYLIQEAFKRLDIHFAWTAPFFGKHAAFAPLLLLVAGIVLGAQRKVSVALAVLATIALILFSFCFAKVHDGSASIFFPLVRVFIGMPLVLAWAWAHVDWKPPAKHFVIIGIILTAIVHSGIRMSQASTTYATEFAEQEGLPVRTWEVARIKEYCRSVVDVANVNDVDGIFILRGNDPYSAQFLAYCIPVFHPEAATTWMIGHDRRAFQRAGMLDSAMTDVLVVGGGPDDAARIMEQQLSVAVVRPSGPQVLFLAQVHRTVSSLSEALR